MRVEPLKERLREKLYPVLQKWLRERLVAQNVPAAQVEQRVAGIKLSFEPADIVNEVMSFGSPTPVEVAVSGPNLADDRAYAEKLRKELAENSLAARPAVRPVARLSRRRGRRSTGSAPAPAASRRRRSPARSSRPPRRAASSSPTTGPTRRRASAIRSRSRFPIERMDSAEKVGLVPIKRPNQTGQLVPATWPGCTRDRARRIRPLQHEAPGEPDGQHRRGRSGPRRPARRRSIESGRTAAARRPVDVRGQILPMQQMFGALAGGKIYEGLTAGLGLAVLVILLLLTAYFQSVRLALVVVSTTPAVLAGVVLALLLTRTTLNIQSFMGAIMAIGVAVANAILLVTFAERARRQGATAVDAGIDGAQHRLRPILMTSCAMIAGMVPMALAMGEAGEQTAPLGRAVIGGLVAATLTTLFMVPSIFAVIQGGAAVESVSLDPDDPQSAYFEGQKADDDANT